MQRRKPKSIGHSHPRGFTLLESLLVMAIVGLFALVTIPIFQNFQNRNDLDLAAVTTAQSVRRAQILSTGVEGDASWGVKVQSGSLVVFKGSSYATRDQNFDETFEVPGSINPSGLNEIVFTKVFGTTTNTGMITLTSNTNEVRTLTVNARGTITY